MSYLCFTEEEINKEFHVLDIDFNIPENTKAHNTDKYECTEEREKNNKRLKAELVVRRGKPFVLKITFDREYDKKQHDLEFSFTTGNHHKITNRLIELLTSTFTDGSHLFHV